MTLALACGSPAPTDFDATVAGSASGSGGSGGKAGSGGAGGSSTGGSSENGGAAAGGSAGSAGSAGSGDTGTFAANEEPIDDMEDGDSQLIVSNGRDGHWYAINDMTGGWTAPPTGAAPFMMAWNMTPRGSSERAAGLAGGNFTDWGAGLVFDFRSPVGETVPPYDASAYSGLSFYGRSLGGALDVRVTVPDASSHPAGGICSEGNCYNHYHSDVTLTGRWQKYEIPFSSLTKDGSTGGSFNRSVVFGVEFVIAGGTMFDFLIDDIAFTKQ